MNIQEATQSYESWMRKCSTIIESDLRTKHQQMKEDVFLFFRGTYYRWAQLFPKVLSCGDLHVGSFGTWRDSEGRLSWGVDDFDEAFPLPYANDLVRLATSVKMLTDCELLTIKLKIACEAIVEGYKQTLQLGGRPIVLADQEKYLQRLGMAAIKPSKEFWAKLNALPVVSGRLPKNLRAAIKKTLPLGLDYKLVRRKAGMGSLGQLRFVAIGDWKGGCVAREAKGLVPSSSTWVAGRTGRGQGYYQEAIRGAVRSPDPFQRIVGDWLIRRLSPDSNPIEIVNLARDSDEEELLYAMGSEAANVHLGTTKSVRKIVKHLHQAKPNWLRSASKEMAKAMEREWKQYNRG